jgi:trimeric autotransporter adhesin
MKVPIQTFSHQQHRLGFGLLLAVLLATCLSPTAGVARTANSVPDGVTTSDWTGIRAAYESGKRAIVPQSDGTHAARHPGQAWCTAFDGRGFRVTPDEGAWAWGLALRAYGFGDGPTNPLTRPQATTTEANRLVYRWDDHLDEWFVNRAEGLQQGWTVAARPPGVAAAAMLRLELAVSGGLVPRVTSDGSSVSFAHADGTAVVTYGGLIAWDADGSAVPVAFAAAADDATTLVVEADVRRARFPVTIDPLAQQAYLKASNTEADDRFGVSVAISGDTVIVGADEEDSNATGVNGNQADNSAGDSGAAYVFVRTGAVWTQQAYLKASNTEANDFFGESVAISGDTIVVGAIGEDSFASSVNGDQSNNFRSTSGAAYVFVRSGGVWTQQAYLKAFNSEVNDAFGGAVAISGDTIVVGAVGEDSIVAGVNNESSANNSASGSGAAYVFVRTGEAWSQQAYLKASNPGAGDSFGGSVAISGDTLVVGADNEDSIATGVNGNQADNSALNPGAAYVFVRTGGTWAQQAYLKASNTPIGSAFDATAFGRSVAISGDTVVVGARGEDSNAIGVNGDQTNELANGSGAAYVFVRAGAVWTQQAYLKASNTEAADLFGASVAISGDTVVIGAEEEDSNATGVNGNQTDNSAEGSGAAYVFVRTGGLWTQQAYLKASNTDAFDRFGNSVAISGDTVFVGAVAEASNATGVNGNQADDSAFRSGAAYGFVPPSPPTLTIAGTKRLVTTRSSLVLRGTAADPDGDIARIEVQVGKSKFRPATGLASWRFVASGLKPGRTVVLARALDAAGNISRAARLVVTRR